MENKDKQDRLAMIKAILKERETESSEEKQLELNFEVTNETK